MIIRGTLGRQATLAQLRRCVFRLCVTTRLRYLVCVSFTDRL